MVTLMMIVFYFDNALDLGMGAALVYEQEEGISKRVQVAFTANFLLAVDPRRRGVLRGAPRGAYFNLDGYRDVPMPGHRVILMSGMTTVPWSLFTAGHGVQAPAIVEVARDVGRFVVTLGLAVVGSRRLVDHDRPDRRRTRCGWS